MSFTSEVKDELARVMPACPQCEKATLAALVRIEGTLFVSGPARYRVEIATDAPASARLVVRLLHGIYSLKTNLTMRRSVLHKTPNYLIEVPAQPHLADALRDMGVLSAEGGLEMGIKESLVAKPCCAAAYLRGAFLGSGFISNPKSDFHFEITVESEALAEGLVELMARKDITARIMARRSSYMVYLKSGNAITEFLAFTGAHQAALSMEEERVVKSVRNDVNRQINAELANQQKAASAAVEQIYAIRRGGGALRHGGLAPGAPGVHPPAGHLPRGVAEGARPAGDAAPFQERRLPPRPPPRVRWPPSWTRGSSAGSPIEVVNGLSSFSLVPYFLQ